MDIAYVYVATSYIVTQQTSLEWSRTEFDGLAVGMKTASNEHWIRRVVHVRCNLRGEIIKKQSPTRHGERWYEFDGLAGLAVGMKTAINKHWIRRVYMYAVTYVVNQSRVSTESQRDQQNIETDDRNNAKTRSLPVYW